MSLKNKNGKVEIGLRNPTQYDAKVKVLLETKEQAGKPLSQNSYQKWQEVFVPAGKSITVKLKNNYNYNYENGQCSKIVFNWNDAAKTLTIANREGSFEDMQADREFEIILVKYGVGGLENGESKRVSYKGSTVQVNL